MLSFNLLWSPTHPFPNSGFFSHNPHQFPPPQFSPYSGSVWPAQHLNENVAVWVYVQLSVKNINDLTFSNSQGHRQPPPMGSGRIQYHDSGQTTQASVGQSQGLKRKETIPSQAEAGPARKRQKRSDPNEYLLFTQWSVTDIHNAQLTVTQVPDHTHHTSAATSWSPYATITSEFVSILNALMDIHN